MRAVLTLFPSALAYACISPTTASSGLVSATDATSVVSGAARRPLATLAAIRPRRVLQLRDWRDAAFVQADPAKIGGARGAGLSAGPGRDVARVDRPGQPDPIQTKRLRGSLIRPQ